jgi:hypothetical protein
VRRPASGTLARSPLENSSLQPQPSATAELKVSARSTAPSVESKRPNRAGGDDADDLVEYGDIANSGAS